LLIREVEDVIVATFRGGCGGGWLGGRAEAEVIMRGLETVKKMKTKREYMLEAVWKAILILPLLL